LIAAFLVDRGLSDYTAIVGESLGTKDERVTKIPLPELVGRAFGPLNYLILLRDPGASQELYLSGEGVGCIPDNLFVQPETPPILLTHEDVRAIVLGRFRDLPSGPLWDIGAGLGGVSVGLARAFPAREVVAIERSPEQGAFLRANRLRFGAYNMRVVEATAPACLEGEDDPAGIFLGGSGGRLDSILDSIIRRLLPRGILLANFVGLENLSRGLGRLRESGWPHDVVQVLISPGQTLAGLTVLTPQRPVWIVRASRP
jgi:precorrin-6Y C5,15-methyltransferase (decarboxylating)